MERYNESITIRGFFWHFGHKPSRSSAEASFYAFGMVSVRIPDVLKSLVGGSTVVKGSGETVGALIADLDSRYPGLAARLLDESGLRRYINVYVGPDDIRFVDGLDTCVTDGQTVLILPASSGGMFLP